MKFRKNEVKKQVRERYARAAVEKESDRGAASSLAAGKKEAFDKEAASKLVGYSPEELAKLPDGSNLGLGCGNPSALAGLKKGETVLDLGSGGGIDCFLAASKVGPTGRVIGVDMTSEMVERARENARKSGLINVEFRLGEIENLPVTDASVDAIISNCVINLSTDKPLVFSEAFRVLRPGGRMMVSDLALKKPLPDTIRGSIEAYVACVAGALVKDEYLGALRKAGFKDVEIVSEKAFPSELVLEDSLTREVIEKLKIPEGELADIVSSVISLTITAFKPGKRG